MKVTVSKSGLYEHLEARAQDLQVEIDSRLTRIVESVGGDVKALASIAADVLNGETDMGADAGVVAALIKDVALFKSKKTKGALLKVVIAGAPGHIDIEEEDLKFLLT